jgi:putative transposase
MATNKKHSKAEIVSKLSQASDLAEQGKLQSEIARTLGVSVMTLHRWRKALAHADSMAVYKRSNSNSIGNEERRIAELQLENSRLRQLVTDLLLERMKLEEAAYRQKLTRLETKKRERLDEKG